MIYELKKTGVILKVKNIKLIESTNGSSDRKVQKENSLATYDKLPRKWFIVRLKTK
jgi:hypothetical protein